MSFFNYRVHFVGIGGIGMSAIAKMFIKIGFLVSGSDMIFSDTLKELSMLGGSIFVGHSKENVIGSDILVISSAISRSNIEILTAIEFKIPIFYRSNVLSILMKGKYSISISGSHGKTSITYFIGILLFKAKFDATVIIGGLIKEFNSNLLLGTSGFMLIEADESDGSLINYFSNIVVISNIDREHLDFFSTIKKLKVFFLRFISQTSFNGCIVLCSDDKYLREMILNINNENIFTYGIEFDSDVRASNVCCLKNGSYFDLFVFGNRIGNLFLGIPGRHNVYNILASISVAIRLNISFDVIKNTIRSLNGVKRRIEIMGQKNGVKVIDDYAHHPTEIIETLKTVNNSWPENRKVVVFQPHRYTRFSNLFNEFVDSFVKVDILILLPIYRTNKSVKNVFNSKHMYKVIRKKKTCNVFYFDNFEECLFGIESIVEYGDILLTLGAGDVYKIGNNFIGI